MFKFTPMRKLKAGAIAGGVITVLAAFGIQVSSEFESLLKEFVAIVIPLTVFIPKVIEYYTKNKSEDVNNMTLK